MDRYEEDANEFRARASVYRMLADELEAALAADTDSQAPKARLDPRRFSARYSDRVAKIEGGLPMERG